METIIYDSPENIHFDSVLMLNTDINLWREQLFHQ